jgi:hypothetical protein
MSNVPQRACLETRVVDRRRFGADPDPDPTFQYDADPDPSQILHIFENRKNILLSFNGTAMTVYIVYLSGQCRRCHNFQYFGQYSILKCSGKSIVFSLCLVEMVTDPNLDPYLDRQALDADIDPDPAK